MDHPLILMLDAFCLLLPPLCPTFYLPCKKTDQKLIANQKIQSFNVAGRLLLSSILALADAQKETGVQCVQIEVLFVLFYVDKS